MVPSRSKTAALIANVTQLSFGLTQRLISS
jgi:hypothetical protein